MADITLVADVSSIRDAQKALKRFSDASDKLGRSVLGTINKINNVASGWDQVNKAYKQGTINSKALKAAQTELARELAVLNGYYKANGQLNTQRALAELRAAQAARENARATEEAARAAQQAAQRQNELRMRFQEGYAAFARARAQMRDLREALRNNIITTEQYREAVRRLREEQQRQNGQNQGNIRSQNNLGLAVQQTGYQVGDFFVQVQSGTNALVAFGQQATQLVGVLPLIHAQLGMSAMRAIALSTGLGIAIPIVTAIGAAFMRTSGSGKTLEQTLSDLEQASSDLHESFTFLERKDLQQTFGFLTESVLEASEAMKTLRAQNELKKLEQTLRDIGGLSQAGIFDNFVQGLISIGTFGINIKTPEMLDEEKFKKLGLNMSKATFDSYIQGMAYLAKSGDRVSVVNNFNDMMKEIAESGAELPSATFDILNQLYNSMVAVAESNAKFSKETETSLRTQISHQQQIATIQDQVNAARKELRATYNTEERSLQQQIALARMKVQFGEDSVEVERLIAQQARENYRLAQLEKGIKGNLLNDLMEQYDTHVSITNQIGSSADNARDLADALREANSAMAGLAGFSASLDKALAVSVAKVEALRTGANAAVAGTITGMRVDLDRRMQEAVGAGVDRSIVESMFGAERSKISQLEASENQRVKLQESLRGGSSGGVGGGSAKTQEDYLAKLQQEADRKLSLIGLSEQEARVKEIIFQLQDKQLPVEQERIEKIIATEEAIRKANEAEQQREQMMNTITSNIESAFMSVVDGSKSVEDAFKSMLRNIILAIYQQQVAQPAATAIGDIIKSFFANGGAFSKGVQFYAKGDVFNSPTAFQHSGGLGVMGEAGPEAIMPLKRGKNGKLGVQMEGSGGGVTIHQNFNFSANGDDSVKRIIRGEIPRITEATKAAVVDAKRRGGSYGRSF